MKILQSGSENQTTVVFVARQATLPDPFKTHWHLRHLDPTDVGSVMTQLLFNYAEVCLEDPWCEGSAHMGAVFPSVLGSSPAPTLALSISLTFTLPPLPLWPLSSAWNPLTPSLCAGLDPALRSGDPADCSQDCSQPRAGGCHSFPRSGL